MRANRIVAVLVAAVVAPSAGCASLIGITDIVLVDEAPDGGGARDGGGADGAGDAAPAGNCADTCAVIADACKAAPACGCLFREGACANESCVIQNGVLSASCGEVRCTSSDDGLRCARGLDAPCACD